MFNLSVVRYLAWRMSWREEKFWFGGPTGVSSDAMVRESIGGVPVDYETESPLDMSDWGRCRLAYTRAPRRLKRRMRPIMAEYAYRLGLFRTAEELGKFIPPDEDPIFIPHTSERV